MILKPRQTTITLYVFSQPVIDYFGTFYDAVAFPRSTVSAEFSAQIRPPFFLLPSTPGGFAFALRLRKSVISFSLRIPYLNRVKKKIKACSKEFRRYKRYIKATKLFYRRSTRGGGRVVDLCSASRLLLSSQPRTGIV